MKMPTEVQNVVNLWQHRSLTILGRVLVINTLISSLFVYKISVLPNMPLNVVNEIPCFDASHSMYSGFCGS